MSVPEDVDEKCNAELYIADDNGDNLATIKCELPLNHKGPHKETFNRLKDGKAFPVNITWELDERGEDNC